MGASDCANFKLVDGYALNNADGYSYTTKWVDIHSAPYFDVTVVFTGGAPAGTVKLQKSNDLKFTGGNWPQPLQAANVGAVADAIDCPTGNGDVSQTVAGAGVYQLNQHFAGYRWTRVVFTASSNVNTQLDIYMSWKK